MEYPEIRVKILPGQYILEHGTTYKVYQSPPLKQLYQQRFFKIEPPFTNNISKLRQLYRKSSQQQQYIKGKRYRLNQQLPNNQKYFPQIFKISCGGKQTLGCKAYSIYQFNNINHCYYLKQAINQHYHKIYDKRYKKLNHKQKMQQQQHQLMNYLTYIDPQQIKKQQIKQKNRLNWTKSNNKKSILRKIKKNSKDILNNNKGYRRFLTDIERKQKKLITRDNIGENNLQIIQLQFQDQE